MKSLYLLAGFSVRGCSGSTGLRTGHASLSCHRTGRGCGGFSLIELMLVVLVIALLAAMGLATMGYVNRKGAESRAQSEVAALSAAIDSYKLDFGSYPAANPSTLYRELTGQGTVNTNKVYIEPTPGMATNRTAGPFLDPWGNEYRYANPGTRNVGFFDLWSEAGTSSAATNAPRWIRNW